MPTSDPHAHLPPPQPVLHAALTGLAAAWCHYCERVIAAMNGKSFKTLQDAMKSVGKPPPHIPSKVGQFLALLVPTLPLSTLEPGWASQSEEQFGEYASYLMDCRDALLQVFKEAPAAWTLETVGTLTASGVGTHAGTEWVTAMHNMCKQHADRMSKVSVSIANHGARTRVEGDGPRKGRCTSVSRRAVKALVELLLKAERGSPGSAAGLASGCWGGTATTVLLSAVSEVSSCTSQDEALSHVLNVLRDVLKVCVWVSRPLHSL